MIFSKTQYPYQRQFNILKMTTRLPVLKVYLLKQYLLIFANIIDKLKEETYP